MNINLKKLARFLVKAKKNTYAATNTIKIIPEKPHHNELDFSEGKFYYRDSYVGFFQAPGMEEVRLGKNGKTIWTMAYSGGMNKKFQNKKEFAIATFNFLKKALTEANEKIPFRGPKKFKDKDWEYYNKVNGDIIRFVGKEIILFKKIEVFSQDYIGGVVIEKE